MEKQNFTCISLFIYFFYLKMLLIHLIILLWAPPSINRNLFPFYLSNYDPSLFFFLLLLPRFSPLRMLSSSRKQVSILFPRASSHVHTFPPPPPFSHPTSFICAISACAAIFVLHASACMRWCIMWRLYAPPVVRGQQLRTDNTELRWGTCGGTLLFTYQTAPMEEKSSDITCVCL